MVGPASQECHGCCGRGGIFPGRSSWSFGIDLVQGGSKPSCQPPLLFLNFFSLYLLDSWSGTIPGFGSEGCAVLGLIFSLSQSPDKLLGPPLQQQHHHHSQQWGLLDHVLARIRIRSPIPSSTNCCHMTHHLVFSYMGGW